jgi:hypothetical protein
MVGVLLNAIANENHGMDSFMASLAYGMLEHPADLG